MYLWIGLLSSSSSYPRFDLASVRCEMAFLSDRFMVFFLFYISRDFV
jgi:hypothetical protein